MSVLVVGSVALDTIITPKDRVDKVLGGSASYCSLAASRFGPALLVGIAGSDFPAEYIETYRSNNIDLSGLEIVEDGKTFSWSGKYLENFNDRETLDTQLNTFADFHPKIPEKHRNSEFVLLGNIQPSLQLEVMDQVKNSKLIMADTMNLWINTTRDDLDKLVSVVDALVLNDSEAHLYTGYRNVIKAARAIQARGPKIVVVKKGSHGAVLFNEQSIFSCPAFPLEEVVDPTGAGDSFAGAMMGYLASVNDVSDAILRKAMVYGTIVASFTVGGFSTKSLDGLTNEQIEERYSVLKQMVSF
jgi:sugar/nucleoside kinase (ribokinase family)